MSGAWIEWRDVGVKHRGNAAQVDNLRPSKRFRQGIFGCSERANSCWNEKWSYEGQWHWETGKIGQNPCKKKKNYWEKRFIISVKIFSSVNIFLFLCP